MERAFGTSPRTTVGFGDDISAVKAFKDRLAVLKTDMLVGSTDIPPGMSTYLAARKAVVANVSDLAAKGARPYAGLVALGLPASLTKREIQRIAYGLRDSAKEYRFPFVGGDTNEADDIVISIALLALMSKGEIVLRSGAKVGDIVAVSDNFGSAAAGLRGLLERGLRPNQLPRELAQAVYRPRAQLDLGVRLASSGAITASIDSSDGLALSLHELSKMSRVGIQLDQIPVSEAALRFAGKYGYEPTDLALYGGEEYHLVVTIGRKKLAVAQRAAEERLKPIGVVTRGHDVVLTQGNRHMKIARKGWEHFRRRR
jgi:thiamine-monophosphate kinase